MSRPPPRARRGSHVQGLSQEDERTSAPPAMRRPKPRRLSKDDIVAGVRGIMGLALGGGARARPQLRAQQPRAHEMTVACRTTDGVPRHALEHMRFWPVALLDKKN